MVAASPILPADRMFHAWRDIPRDANLPLVWADYLDDQGHAETGRLLRELSSAHRLVRKATPPVNWEEAIGGLPAEWRSVFAIGCAARCVLWMPPEYRAEQEEDLAELLTDLTVEPWSECMALRCEAAKSRYDAASSGYEAAWSRCHAAKSRYEAAWSRYDVVWSGYEAASSGCEAAWSRGEAAWSRYDAAWSRYSVAPLRYDAAKSRESSWQAYWLRAVADTIGVRLAG